MTKQLLLDCTLRDGGFVNDWNFGFGSIKSIISRLDHAGVDIIEIGFIDQRRGYDRNRSIFPDSDSALPLFEGYVPESLVVAMIDYGTCGIDRITDRKFSCLDGIRVIFKKSKQDEALSFLSDLKDKGYKIFANPVSVTEYSYSEIGKLTEKINRIEPYSVSVVDTYGLMHSKELIGYFNAFDANLNDDIILGYHAHNNFQMAYANSILLLSKETKRTISVDASLYGMGKSAGNTCTELLAMYMNEFCGRNYNISQIHEAIDVDILKEFNKKQWGYNYEYYISALNDCHPDYVKYLLDKKTLSVKSVNEILSRISEEEKLYFNINLIEELYCEHQHVYCDDKLAISELKRLFAAKEMLLLGPGKSIHENNDVIEMFIRDSRPIVISINFFNSLFHIDYVFMGNAKRYSQFFHEIHNKEHSARLICTSNITEVGEDIDFLLNYSGLLADDEVIRDNPLIMFLKLLKKTGMTKIHMAGFDGYSHSVADNYYDDYIRFLYCDDNVLLRNEAIKKELKEFSGSMEIVSLTPTKYMS